MGDDWASFLDIGQYSLPKDLRKRLTLNSSFFFSHHLTIFVAFFVASFFTFWPVGSLPSLVLAAILVIAHSVFRVEHSNQNSAPAPPKKSQTPDQKDE